MKPTTPLIARIDHIRALYSAIGEPLPAPIITDLYLHLPKIAPPRPKDVTKPIKKS